MASGKTHHTISLVVGIPIAGTLGAMLGLYLGGPLVAWWVSQIALLGVILGDFAGPDQDVDGLTRQEQDLVNHPNRLIRWFGWLWVIYWYPFAKVMPHRGPSHWFLVGSILRFIYMFWSWWWLIWITGENLLNTVWLWWPLLLGVVVSDTLHILCDTKLLSKWADRNVRGDDFVRWYYNR